MKDCIFCKIVKNELPSEKVYETDDLIAFKDVNPQAPVHILIIPKCHIDNVGELEDKSELGGKLISAAAHIAGQYHLDSGYRITTNTGEHGGQTVGHLHFHLLGGKQLGERLD